MSALAGPHGPVSDQFMRHYYGARKGTTVTDEARLEQMIVRRAMRWYWAHSKSPNGSYFKAGLRPIARVSLYAACAQLARKMKK